MTFRCEIAPEERVVGPKAVISVPRDLFWIDVIMDENRDGKLAAISEAQIGHMLGHKTGHMISRICAIGYSTDLSKISRRPLSRWPLFHQVFFSIVLSIFVVALFSSQSLASGKVKYFSGNSHSGSLNRLKSGNRLKPGNRQSGKNIRHKNFTKKFNMRGKQAWGLPHSRSNRSLRYPGFKVIGARIINVSKVLSIRHSKGEKRRGNGIRVVTYTNPGQRSDISHFVVRYGYGLTAPHYEDILCGDGYDCVIQLGNSRSSPKIIVVGEKRTETGMGDNSGPMILYPPS